MQHTKNMPDNTIILMVDAFDVIFQMDHFRILTAYQRLGAPDILFSAESNCWPAALLEAAGTSCDKIPVLPNNAPRFLNSGGWLPTKKDKEVQQ
jgi:hypothetical protein